MLLLLYICLLTSKLFVLRWILGQNAFFSLCSLVDRLNCRLFSFVSLFKPKSNWSCGRFEYTFFPVRWTCFSSWMKLFAKKIQYSNYRQYFSTTERYSIEFNGFYSFFARCPLFHYFNCILISPKKKSGQPKCNMGRLHIECITTCACARTGVTQHHMCAYWIDWAKSYCCSVYSTHNIQLNWHIRRDNAFLLVCIDVVTEN